MSCGEEGLNLIKEKKYDLIIIDYFLPDINGEIIIKNIIKNNLIDTQNIIVTSVFDEVESELTKNLGICAFLPKPINIKKFYDICDIKLFD